MLTTSCSCKKDPTNYVGSWDGKNWIGYQSGSLVVNGYDDDYVGIISSDNYFANNLIIPKKVKLSYGQTKKLTTIGDNAFNFGAGGSYFSGRLTLPHSLKRIGVEAFAFCNDISSFDMSNCASLTSIGSFAFLGCSSLASLSLPNTLTSIGDYAFRECSSLTSITLPNSLTSIGAAAFQNCSSLASITAAYDSNPTFTVGVSVFGSVPSSGTVKNTGSLASQVLLDYLKNKGLPDGWHLPTP